jgi:fatty acid desaturase
MWWRRRLNRGVRTVLVLTLSGQLGIQAALVLDLSDEGPGHPPLAVLALTLSATAAVAAAALGALTHGPAWVSVLVLACVLGVALELLPERIDSHESFVERPSSRSTCHGLVYTSYPWGTMDASETVWCVGWETARPPG